MNRAFSIPLRGVAAACLAASSGCASTSHPGSSASVDPAPPADAGSHALRRRLYCDPLRGAILTRSDGRGGPASGGIMTHPDLGRAPSAPAVHAEGAGPGEYVNSDQDAGRTRGRSSGA
jgi:hypothetical protein